MTRYFTNYEDISFTPGVYSKDKIQMCKCAYTIDYATLGHGKTLMHLCSDDSYYGAPCEGCKRENMSLWEVKSRFPGRRPQYLCKNCIERGDN